MSIRQHNFDLRNSKEGRKLLLELYNLKKYYEDFKSKIDHTKLAKLVTLNEKAKDLDTVTKAAKSRSARAKASQAKSKADTPEHLPTVPEDQTDAFNIPDIQETLHIWGVGDVFTLTTVSNPDMVRNTSLLITITESLSGKNVVQ